jgi:competence protein ComEA
MVERAQIPACSQEVLASAGQESFLEEQRITVEVAGAVREPGVWQLAIGSRQADAVEKAGGYSQRADRTFVLKNMNLAQPLEDGQKIYIPFEGESTQPANSQGQSVPTATPGSLISLNTASAKDLQTLPGIGEARAAAIIEGRPYTSLNELTEKKILTETLWKDIQSLVGL